jgi:hypothetical protein
MSSDESESDRGKSTRFSSTNQPARRKKAVLDDVHKLLDDLNAATTMVVAAGRQRQMTPDEVLVERMVVTALRGNAPEALEAAKYLFKLVPPPPPPPEDLNMVIEVENGSTDFRWRSDGREVRQSAGYFAKLRRAPRGAADMPVGDESNPSIRREKAFRLRAEAALAAGEWTPDWAENELGVSKRKRR